MIEAILFDLGNVVLEVDFRRTFARWADSAGVDVAVLHERWSLDSAYCAHETGNLGFEDYIHALEGRLGIRMSADDWLSGWNDVFVGPYPRVQARLGELSSRLPLYAFTNTNPTHEQAWRERYLANSLHHFREIYVSSTIGLRKPDVAAFHWVADAMGLYPEQILFLDDTLENVEGAAAAGLQSEWIRTEADVLSAIERF